jgi:colanic acid/amylovoran biosynthesis glycosyltransferase
VSDRAPHLAYIASAYPYVSHTFIQNEVAALRELGLEIDTFAIRRAPLSECRTQADREARATTYSLRPPRPFNYLRAHLAGLLERPSEYRRAVVRALRLGAWSAPDLAHQLAYVVQGVVLWDRCRAAGVEHVHAHLANVGSDVASVAALLGGDELSWSFTMHGPTEFYNVRHFHLAEKARDARFVICISEFARSQLMTLIEPEHWGKLRVVHCGVDVERFARVDHDRNHDPVQIACVGRLVPEKGQPLLIEAVAAIARSGADVRVTFAGDGPERPALEQLATELRVADRIEFLGAVPHTDVDELLRRTDIFCLPSFAEGVPIVLMEAMAMELPVVASRVMGIPELIEDRVSGRLVAPGSLSNLVDALSDLVSDPDQRRQLGRAGRTQVASQFELRANAERLREVYGELLGSQAASAVAT